LGLIYINFKDVALCTLKFDVLCPKILSKQRKHKENPSIFGFLCSGMFCFNLVAL